ncbi:DsbA family oxidoreductase [Chryseobacterium sp. c4a]|uniref:DsbA family oxidoreductase n=1 Tax=Chryseobacterium sp. c4a TaxID=1573582 RepID=UPI00135B720F|nr:DsbA family oxidoreductase [Chryseobacterium sp. c4a]
MRVDIWYDVICPYCYIGQENFRKGLEEFPHRNEVEVHLHSFELAPQLSGEAQPTPQVIAKRYGTTEAKASETYRNIGEHAKSAGLPFDHTQMRTGNTFDAHRLIHFAAQYGKEEQLSHALMKGYFAEGEAMNDRAALTKIADQVGLPTDKVKEVLSSNEYADAVRKDEKAAAEHGATGVPFFIFDNRYSASGAQPPEYFTGVLTQVWNETQGK